MFWIIATLVVVCIAFLVLRRPPVEPHAAVEHDETDAPPGVCEDLPIVDHLDLHGVPPAQVGPLVDAYVEEAQRLGFQWVRSYVHHQGYQSI